MRFVLCAWLVLMSGCSEGQPEIDLEDTPDFRPAEFVDIELYPSNQGRADGLKFARENGQANQIRIPGEYLRRYYANYPIGQGETSLQSTTVRMVGGVTNGELHSFPIVGDFDECAYIMADFVCYEKDSLGPNFQGVVSFEVSGMDKEYEDRIRSRKVENSKIRPDVPALEEFEYIGAHSRGSYPKVPSMSYASHLFEGRTPAGVVILADCRVDTVPNAVPQGECSFSYRKSEFLLISFRAPLELAIDWKETLGIFDSKISQFLEDAQSASTVTESSQ